MVQIRMDPSRVQAVWSIFQVGIRPVEGIDVHLATWPG